MAGVFVYSMSFLTQLATVGTAATQTQSEPTAITHSWAASAIPIALIPPIKERKLPKRYRSFFKNFKILSFISFIF